MVSPEIAANWAENGMTPDKRLAFSCGTGWPGRPDVALREASMGFPRRTVYDGRSSSNGGLDPIDNQIFDRGPRPLRPRSTAASSNPEWRRAPSAARAAGRGADRYAGRMTGPIIRPAYSSWPAHNARLRDVVAGLTPSSWRSGRRRSAGRSGRRSATQPVSGSSGCATSPGEPGAETTRFSDARLDCRATTTWSMFWAPPRPRRGA